MYIIVLKYLVPKKIIGLTIFPFIIVKDKKLKLDKVFINHEKIHLRQQLELLILPFFVWYFLEFFFRFMICLNWSKSYRSISFEKEAYCNEMNFNYLEKRTLYRFLKYII
ncbi:MAG TPA: hypothetical protein PK218_09090 [Flavobacterium sp.]|jgi:hypothetical protein|nr:hypothetical protein [Bacteroidota bacterium]HPW98704.1 hypothetical protein [Flavobacterium sp.]HQA75197.1 hypothetical protein [Flavobacterium sp.]